MKIIKHHSWMLGVIVSVISPFAVFADRVVIPLTHWTCDGGLVTIPHTWNANDGADGSPGIFQDTNNSVAGRAYLRCSKTYRTDLKEPMPGKRYFIRFEGASIRALVAVNGREVGVHRGPFTAFTYEITGCLREHDNILEVVVDNYFDERQPPIYADYTVCGGLYRPVYLIETDPVCIDPTCAAASEDDDTLNSIPDVYAFNEYPGWYGTNAYDMASRIDQAFAGHSVVGIGEYGAGASVHHHENPLADHERHNSPFHPEETQTAIHRIEYGCNIAVSP